MFKKRTINKDQSSLVGESSNDNNGKGFEKRPINSGIDLRKDIEEMEEIISEKKEKQLPNQRQADQQKRQNTEKPQHSVFKTKKINKFTSHILKNLPTITPQKLSQHGLPSSSTPIQTNFARPQPKAFPQSESSVNENPKNELVKPNLNNYGLLDKSHFKSTSGNNYEVIETGKGKNHQEALMDYYIKKRMQQMTKPTNPNTTQSFGSTSHSVYKQPEAWEQVLEIQKQYLTKEQKIKEYSIEEIQKKLQKLGQQTIKGEIEKRNIYLKDLLENQYERMQYASKKQLKIMKQDKERIEKELNSKYRDSGRRNYIDNIKNQVL